MPKQLLQEALKVIENILGNTLESEEYLIIRIGKQYQEKYKPIFTSSLAMRGIDVFYYDLPNLPKFIIEEQLPLAYVRGLYEYASVSNLEFLNGQASKHEINTPQKISYRNNDLDQLSLKLLELEIVEDGEMLTVHNTDISNQYTFLFSRSRLLQYFNYYANSAPKIDYENQQFLFLGESFPMLGAIEQAIIEELIQNINSVVPMVRLKEIRVQVDKDHTRRDSPNFQSMEQNIKDTVDNFVKKVNKNENTKGVLFSRQSSGFGLFIDQSKLKNNFKA